MKAEKDNDVSLESLENPFTFHDDSWDIKRGYFEFRNQRE
jgi:hypothetical protein